MSRGSPLVGGVDEAGRGCLLGPLVVAGVSVARGVEKELRELGVRDSKKLSPSRREAIYPEILRLAKRVYWTSIPPHEIDEVVTRAKRLRKLNYLEAVYFARVVDRLDAKTVTVDASDVIPRRFKDDISRNLVAQCHVVARHKADRDFPVVSAASIVAKVQRDREVELLRKANGDFGSGYPSDPATRRFFTEWMKKGTPLPAYVRKSWKTWDNLEQSLLDAY